MVGPDRPHGDAGAWRPGLLRGRGARTARDWWVDTVAFVLAAGSRRPHPERHRCRHRQSDVLGARRHRRRAGDPAVSPCGGGGVGRSEWRWCAWCWARSRRLAPLPACSRCPRSPSIATSGPPWLSPRCSFRRRWCARSGSGGPTRGRCSCRRWRSPPPRSRGACSSVLGVCSSPPSASGPDAPRPIGSLHAERARLAERTRIAREMHDVLAHRISRVALHAGALEVALDLPPAHVRESAALLRLTAHQALEELRDVIGVLREEPGQERPSTAHNRRWPTSHAWWRGTRRTGAKIDFEMQVDGAAGAPGPLGRDTYRIVQEALTNISKHARGTLAQVRVVGAPEPRPACLRSQPAGGGPPRPSGASRFWDGAPRSAGAGDTGQWRPGARTGCFR